MKKGSSRQNRKVNFETNSENIKELKECIEWINEIFDTQRMGKVYTSDKKLERCFEEYEVQMLGKLKNEKYSSKKRNTIRNLEKGYYYKDKLYGILQKNKYFIAKRFTESDTYFIVDTNGICTIKEKNKIVHFYKEEVIEFLFFLKTAKEQNVLQAFLRVPDVWFGIRQIRKVGLSEYLM